MVDDAPRYPTYDYPTYDPDVETYEEKPTGYPIAPYQVGQSAEANYRELSVPLFLSDLTADRIPANTCRLDRASEGLRHEFSQLLWPAHPPEFWPRWFLRTLRATSLPAPRLPVPLFFRWRQPRCIRVRCN